MGRYYYGDIEGKFWFAVQPSTDPEFFGMEEYEHNFVNYYINETDIELIEDGLKECKKNLKGWIRKMEAYWKKNLSYNDGEMAKVLNISEEKLKHLIFWYARYRLGKKIYKQVKNHGDCSIEAEI